MCWLIFIFMLDFRLGDIDILYEFLEVMYVLNVKEIVLVKQLKVIGVKMYGVFWCFYCFE